MELGRKIGKEHFLGYNEVAAALGLSPSSIRAYYSTGRMPQPDVTVGNTPGWTPETITAWVALRPGAGTRTDLKRKESTE